MDFESEFLTQLEEMIHDYRQRRNTNSISAAEYNGGRRKAGVASNGGPTKIFRFEIAEDGTFLYGPPSEWEYNGRDVIQFKSGTGPFTITAVPDSTTALGSAYQGPWTQPLRSNLDGDGNHVAQINPYDAHLPVQVRQGLVNQQGYIQRYKYTIAIDGTPQRDDTKNGVYRC